MPFYTSCIHTSFLDVEDDDEEEEEAQLLNEFILLHILLENNVAYCSKGIRKCLWYDMCACTYLYMYIQQHRACKTDKTDVNEYFVRVLLYNVVKCYNYNTFMKALLLLK